MNKLTIIVFLWTSVMAMTSAISSTRSPQHLIMFAEMEFTIFNILEENSRDNMINKISIVDEYIEDFKESALKPTEHLNIKDAAVAISKNPIMSYRMMRRYAKILGNLSKEMSSRKDSDVFKRIAEVKSRHKPLLKWPSDEEMKDAIEALIRIHQVYDFDLNEFASGNIMGTQTNVKLNSIHCHEIGEHALKMKLYYSGIVWLETALALRKAESSTRTPNLNVHQIQKSLDDAIKAHDVAWGRRGQWDYNYFSRQLNETSNTESRKTLREVVYEKNKGKKIPCFFDSLHAWELCSGKNFQTEEEISKLFCKYDTRSNLAWTINPLKVEQLSLSPFLVQVYDVLGEKAMESVKLEAFPNLVHAPTINFGKGAAKRTSTRSWLDDPSESFRHLTRRAELISGFKCGWNEPIDAASYAFGGHFETHYDGQKASQKGKDKSDFVTTFMFILEDVEMGGATVFPRMGVASRAIKGSAVYWYNTLKNGRLDMNSCHGGCPVVLGHKWIAAKRIRINEQMLIRPCGLNRNE